MRREMEGTARKRRSARVRSINHDPRYHELYYLLNDIIVLVFRKLTYLFERFCKVKKTKGEWGRWKCRRAGGRGGRLKVESLKLKVKKLKENVWKEAALGQGCQEEVRR